MSTSILLDQSFFPLRGLEEAFLRFEDYMTHVPPFLIEEYNRELLAGRYDCEPENWDYSSAFAVMIDRETAVRLLKCDAGQHDIEWDTDGEYDYQKPDGQCKHCGQCF